jgi:hypothetical protein
MNLAKWRDYPTGGSAPVVAKKTLPVEEAMQVS